MPQPNSQQVVKGRDGKMYKKVFGQYGELQSINEFYDKKPGYVQMLKDLKPATRARAYINQHHRDNFLLQSGIVQAPLQLLESVGFGRKRQMMHGGCGYRNHY